MTWKEKSVSYNSNKEEVFKSVLGDVKVFWDGVERKEINKDEDWSKILEVFDEENIFKGFLSWEDVDDVEIFLENLYFPHVDFLLDYGEEVLKKRKIIFFKANNSRKHDDIRKFYNSVKKRMNAYNEKRKLKTGEYHYKEDASKKSSKAKDNDGQDQKKKDRLSVQDLDLDDLMDEYIISDD